MNRRRDVLHHTKVEEFVAWALKRGYSRQPTKGCFEIFRLHNPTKGEILIGHKRTNTDHVTTTGRLTQLVGIWLKERRIASPAAM